MIKNLYIESIIGDKKFIGSLNSGLNWDDVEMIER